MFQTGVIVVVMDIIDRLVTYSGSGSLYGSYMTLLQLLLSLSALMLVLLFTLLLPVQVSVGHTKQTGQSQFVISTLRH